MGPGAAAKGRRGPAGAVPGPKLALVALVAAVFEPFRAISADHVGGNNANRRNSHLRRYVGAQRLVEGGLETMGPTRKCSRRPESVARAADKLTNLCDKLGRKMLTLCFRAPWGGRTVLALQKRPRYAPGTSGPTSRKAFREAGANPRAESPAVSEYSWGEKC